MTRRRMIFKVLLVALIFATWAFVSIGCVRGTTAEEEWNRTFEDFYWDTTKSVRQITDGIDYKIVEA